MMKMYACLLAGVLTGLLIGPADAANEYCCSKIRRDQHPECFSACATLFLSTNTLQILERAANVYWKCPQTLPPLAALWTCLLDNYPVVRAVERWEGRACCDLATSVHCREACMGVHSRYDMPSQCEEEGKLNVCLNKFEGSHECCRDASTIECRMACRAYFATNEQPQVPLNATCTATQELKRVSKCVLSHAGARRISNPALSLPCCDHAATETCASSCRHNLTNAMQTSSDNVLRAVTQACPEDWYSNDMWTCFLRVAVVDDEQEADMKHQRKWDYARYACCSRATQPECRALCTTFYESWHGWEDFSNQCLDPPGEEELQNCIQEVEEPCKPGCDNLEFCANFNNRPDNRFRMCNAKADGAARDTFSGSQLEEGAFGWFYQLPLRNISECEPKLWKAVVCALHIKPCSANSHSNKICKSDCVAILSACGPFSPGDPFNPEALCSNIPVVSGDPEKCISIGQFTEPSPHAAIHDEITHPCQPNPCEAGQICEVNRGPCDRRRGRETCQPHTCRWACKMGPTSSLLVPSEQVARIVYKTDSDNRECHKTCMCSASAGMPNGGELLSSCFELGCENPPIPCTEGDNSCSGCSPQSSKCAAATRTALPCNCGDGYMPVCTVHGRTFDNPCLAECAGYGEKHYEYGTCARNNPCKHRHHSPCLSGEKCVPWRRTCLGLRPEEQCSQHKCVSSSHTCDGQSHRHVCDTDGIEHDNLCTLVASRKRLAYRGRCVQHNCEISGTVCGVNGENYASECAAWADRTAVDYYTPCMTVGKFTNDLIERSPCGSKVTCPERLPTGCAGVLVPGSCCPICGGMVTVSYDRGAVHRMMEAGSISRFTLHRWAHHLRPHVTMAECDLFVSLSDEDQLIVVVMPLIRLPTKLQVLACNSEAQKIGVLINNQSPVLHSSAELSIAAQASVLVSTFTPVRPAPKLTASTLGSSGASPLSASCSVLFLFLLNAVLLILADMC